jgi:hypothetical protein
VLNKRTLQLLGQVEFPCSRHPLKGSLDPARGQWFMAGTESGSVAVYHVPSIASAAAEASLVQSLGPAFVMARPPAAAEHATTGHHRAAAPAAAAPVYCALWNPRLHMVAVSARYAGGSARLLSCSSAAARAQAAGSLPRYGLTVLVAGQGACLLHDWVLLHGKEAATMYA